MKKLVLVFISVITMALNNQVEAQNRNSNNKLIYIKIINAHAKYIPLGFQLVLNEKNEIIFMHESRKDYVKVKVEMEVENGTFLSRSNDGENYRIISEYGMSRSNAMKMSYRVMKGQINYVHGIVR